MSQEFQTEEQQEEFNNLIRDCTIYRFDSGETQAYIKSKMKLEIPLDTISRIIKNLKDKDVKSKLILYQNNSDEYQKEYLERIEELKFYQKELWQIIDKNTVDPMLKLDCFTELRECTTALMNSYNRIFGISLKKKAI